MSFDKSVYQHIGMNLVAGSKCNFSRFNSIYISHRYDIDSFNLSSYDANIEYVYYFTGYVNRVNDIREGMIEVRKAVDQVLETGKPTYVIASFPFRPGGHASDANSSPEHVVILEHCMGDNIGPGYDIRSLLFLRPTLATRPFRSSYQISFPVLPG